MTIDSSIGGLLLDVLREHLARSLRGGQAFVPYVKALEGIRPELRGVRPNEKLHSIYEELEHMRRAQEDLLYYALEAEWESPDWPSGFWPETKKKPTDGEWDQTVEGFLSDLDRTVQMVEDPKIDLLSQIPGSEYTYLREVTLIIEHNAYHLGKIMDIRKTLGNWNR
jgi:hypothetical protein